MATKQLAIIDATTGTVLAPDNLIAVLATEKQLDRASNSDSDAFDLAAKKGHRVPCDLLHLIASGKRPTQADIYLIAGIFGWDIEQDNDRQMVIYTGTRARR
jgi:hypothetical protein